MKRIILTVFIVTSCKNNIKHSNTIKNGIFSDNVELSQIHYNDQKDRQKDYFETDWDEVSKNDSLRRLRVMQLIKLKKLHTSKDYRHAAMIFQHGGDSTSYKMAMNLMKKSIELNPNADKWLLAAATDRYLLSIGKPQIYGTQYHKNGDEPWKLADIDTTKITNKERRDFGVETLIEQREKVERMNFEEGL